MSRIELRANTAWGYMNLRRMATKERNAGRRVLLATLFAAATLVPLVGGASTALAGGGGCPGTVKEPLSGPAIGGVTPEGQAQADESTYCSGGSTILTVQVKNVDLADGTVLDVTLDCSPEGTLTLNRQEGTMTADLGHMTVTFNHIRVSNHGVQACGPSGATIMTGGFFS